MGAWTTFNRPNPYPDLKLREKIWSEGRSTWFHTAIDLPGESVDLLVCLDEFLAEKTVESAERCNAFIDRQRDKIARKARAIQAISGAFVRRMFELEVELRPMAVRA